ncbi:hypothetical protein SODG_004768 [Sodalis praecaptivus]
MQLLKNATIIQGAKGGGGGGHTPTEQSDNLLSVSKLKMLLALSEGEIQGELTAQNIFLNNTPLANDDGSYNFTGVVWEYRKGTQDQDYIQGMPEVDNEVAVGIGVKTSSPWVHAFSDLNLDAVRIKLALPAQYQYKDNGDMVGTVTRYAIDLSVDGSAWQTVVEGAFDGKTTSEYPRDHRINLPRATSGWSLRVRRITADSTSTKLINAFKVASYTEVIDSKLRYPHTALLYVELDAKQFNGDAPKVTCKPKGMIIRVPDNYDTVTRTYSGTWTGNFKWAYSNNPAWIFYDLCLNTIYGMGNRVDASMIDKWSLYQIARYCDEPVSNGADGKEPRFTCNVYIQSQEEAYTVLKDLAATFRGSPIGAMTSFTLRRMCRRRMWILSTMRRMWSTDSSPMLGALIKTAIPPVRCPGPIRRIITRIPLKACMTRRWCPATALIQRQSPPWAARLRAKHTDGDVGLSCRMPKMGR